jgi:hypothetical protein
MMAKRISIKHKRKEAPEWVFSWRRPGNPALSKWIAVLVTGAMFTLLLTAVQIHVSPPITWAAPKTSVIYVADDAEGRALTQRAREGGPFPSRFLPSQWEGAAALERELLGTTRWTPPPYVSTLKDLPDAADAPLRLAARGEPVLPKHLPAMASAPARVKLKLAPVIYPLSGIRAEEIPNDLPPIEAAADGSMTAEAWRFLVRLDAAGHVWDCVSLAGGDEAGPSALEAWLRRVTFMPESEKPSRWIAVGIGFSNQPDIDGTDTR